MGNPAGPNISERFCTIFVPIFIFSAVQFYPARRLDPVPIFRAPGTALLYRTRNGPVLVPERRRAARTAPFLPHPAFSPCCSLPQRRRDTESPTRIAGVQSWPYGTNWPIETRRRGPVSQT